MSVHTERKKRGIADMAEDRARLLTNLLKKGNDLVDSLKALQEDMTKNHERK
jgi:type II secretory pathway component PulF